MVFIFLKSTCMEPNKPTAGAPNNNDQREEPPGQTSQQHPQTDERQQAIEQEGETARLRSERKSVEDASRQDKNE